SCLGYSTDGRTLAALAEDGMALVWDTASGKERWRVRIEEERFTERGRSTFPCLALSVDGRRLVWFIPTTRTAGVLEVASGKECVRWRLPEDLYFSLAF